MATRTVRGALPEYGYKAGGTGMRKGVVLVIGADNTKAVLASAVGQGKYRGIQLDEGKLPDGTADSTAPDMVNAQKLGIAWALAAANTSPAAGDQAWSNASGQLITRTPYSFSGFILGQFDEGVTVGANPEFVSLEMFPQYIEVCRPVSAGCVGAVTAATVFMVAPGQAKASSAVPLYVARFAGETVRNLTCNLKTAPGGADTVAYTIQKSSDQGNTWTDTAITCTISAAAKTASDLTHTVSLAAGDMLALKAVSSAGTAADCMCSFDVT